MSQHQWKKANPIVKLEPPASLVALRNELALPHNSDLFNYAIKGRNFDECITLLVEKLGMTVQGHETADEMCHKLVTAIKGRPYQLLSTRHH